MTAEEFVAALRRVALEAAVNSTLSVLQSPPGRRPGDELIKASDWYRNLSDDDREQLRTVIAMVAHDAVFGVLAVLDGVRTVESTADKGAFGLTFVKNGEEVELNPAKGEMLHDLLNAQMPQRGR